MTYTLTPEEILEIIEQFQDLGDDYATNLEELEDHLIDNYEYNRNIT